MGTRGPKSAASLEVVGAGNASRLARPEPLPDLTDEAAEVWMHTVEALPADWFRPETWHLLAAYCRAVVNERLASQIMRRMEADEDFDLDEYAKASRLQEMQARAMSSHATRLRLTPQSTYDKSKKKPITGAKPWD